MVQYSDTVPYIRLMRLKKSTTASVNKKKKKTASLLCHLTTKSVHTVCTLNEKHMDGYVCYVALHTEGSYPGVTITGPISLTRRQILNAMSVHSMQDMWSTKPMLL